MGDTFSCVGTKSSKKDALEEIYGWQLDRQSDASQIVIPRDKFNQYFQHLKDMLNINENQMDLDCSELRVQILGTRISPAVSMFAKQLQYELSKQNYINTTTISTLEEVSPQAVLVLVCNRNQGESTYAVVDKCLTDVKNCLYEKIILVILHVIRQEKLPKLSASKEVRDIEKYRTIGRVVDMGFFGDNIYPCQMNATAIDDIKQFCKEFNLSDIKRPIKDSKVPVCSKRTLQHSDDKMENEKKANTTQEPLLNRIYLINPSNTNALSAFVEMFRTKLKIYGIGIDVKETREVTTIDPGLPLIIVCNASSRIESDIKHCYDENLRAVRNRTILVVVHVVREGKEPQIFTETKCADDSIFVNSSLIKIIDIAFDSESGMYKCKMNENAVNYFKNQWYAKC